MTYTHDDTIAAIASAPGGAARGIVRVSGPQVIACLGQLFQPVGEEGLATITRPTAVPGVVHCTELFSPLPCELYLWPTSRSYTRQPLAELHTLGSPPLLECVLRAVCAAGARVAEPGEFTLRAFLGGRLDLTQAEAVLGVIDAANGRDFDVALRQLAGGISGPMTALRDRLLDFLAHLEAGLDFAEEEIEFITTDELDHDLRQASEQVQRLAAQMTSRSESTDLVRVVLVGWPNVGKSSLFNALLGGQQALVSETAGTTRDYLTAEITVDGMTLQLVDTAGIDLSDVEPDKPPVALTAAAQQLAARQHAQAHLRLLCLDAGRPLNDWERRRLAEAKSGDLIVLTKTDCPRRIDAELPAAVATSARSGAGVDALRRRLAAAIQEAAQLDSSVVAATAARCRESLRLAAECLDRARGVARSHAEELVAAELRVALTELGKVVGAVYTDDVLDRIFSRFCIGK
jgi:tRNA modification GTPase